MKKRLLIAGLMAAVASLAIPGVASAASLGETVAEKTSELDMVWVAVACVLVFLMQAGFMFLEIGFSRQKNVGTGVAKILINFAIVTIAWWAIGYGVAEGGGNDFFGDSGFFFHFNQTIGSGEEAFQVAGADSMLMLYGLAFCAVSLAIVWGTTLERIKFGAYVIYAIVFGAVVYPLVAHAVWGGGLLSDIGGKPVMDFAGSSVVHLTGAVGALAALLLLGPRIGKYDAQGRPRAIPGHSMPLVGLGVIILWIGWFGFNGGSTFETAGSFFGEVMLNTQLAAAAGVIGASLAVWLKSRTLDVGMAGNGAIAGLVGITAPSGFVE
jgi:ammonium transporter, Amt family